jgi:hypothetical protein
MWDLRAPLWPHFMAGLAMLFQQSQAMKPCGGEPSNHFLMPGPSGRMATRDLTILTKILTAAGSLLVASCPPPTVFASVLTPKQVGLAIQI